jgi:hypothetical protein
LSQRPQRVFVYVTEEQLHLPITVDVAVTTAIITTAVISCSAADTG